MTWDGGSTREWRETRAAVLERNRLEHGGRCRLQIDGHHTCPRHGQPCDAVCTGPATHVHHTRGRSVTGDDPRYLIAACAACNLHVGDPQRHAVDPPGRSVTRW